MFGDFGAPELTLIATIVLLLFGVGLFPEIPRLRSSEGLDDKAARARSREYIEGMFGSARP